MLHGHNRLSAESGVCISGSGYGEFTAMTINTEIHAKLCNISKDGIGHGNLWKQIFCLLDLFLKLKLLAVILFHKSIRIFIELTAALDDVNSFCDIENRDDTRMQTKTVKKLRTKFTFLRVAGADKYETGWVADTDTFAFNNVFTACGNVEKNVNKMVIKQVDLVNVKEPTVCLGKKTRLKCFYTAGKSLFYIDCTANTVFGSTKRKINNRNRNFLNPDCLWIKRLSSFFAIFSFEILLKSTVIGITLNPFNQRKHFSKRSDSSTFSCTPVTHNQYSANPRINDIEDQT